MKRTVSFVLCIVLSISLLASTAFAASGMTNFQKTLTYSAGKFSDVATGDWFGTSVKNAYEYNLMQGLSSNFFGVDSNVKLSELVAMAARLNSIYKSGSASFAAGSPWYQSYVDYAVANGIISQNRFENYEAYATRYQVAEVFAAALPDTTLPAINTINVGDIPDVSLETPYEPVYLLYRAGVLTGKTAAGSFGPSDKVLRSEVAAVVSRMADASLRVKFTIDKSASGTITSGAELLAALNSARQSISLALQSYNSAELYYLGLSNVTLGAAALSSANEYAQMAAQFAQSAAAFCKANSKYSGAYDNSNTAYLGCITALKNIAAVAAAPFAAKTDWDLAPKVMSACGETLSSAATTVSAIG